VDEKNMRKASKVHGFTLIEVMIVVAIVAILAAVAYPSYQQSITKTRRTTAQACLVEVAQFMERFYTTNLRYDQTIGGVDVVLANPTCRTDIAAFYVLEFVTDEPTQSTYALQAAPQGGQATADAGCGTLTLTQAGTKSRSGAKALNQCWQ
jgi:type IV pilus assembly protein PilE